MMPASTAAVSPARVERRSGITPAIFVEQYLARNKPVIVTDGMTGWNISWTPADLDARFGSELVQVYNDLFDLTNVTPLRSYLQQWFGREPAGTDATPPPYVRWYTKLKDVDFVWADQAFASFKDRWSLPYFLPTTDYLLPCSAPGEPVSPNRDSFPGRGLFISCRGASTRLHRDPWASDGVLCQIYGEKKLLFYSPDQAAAISEAQSHAGASGRKPSAVPENLSPAFEDILRPGEVLFVPRGWFHHVVSLTDSISLTWNFVHATSWPVFFEYLTSPAANAEMPVLRFFAKLGKSRR